MRWLVAGANGMLGTDLCAVLRAAGHEVTGADLPELDILAPQLCLEQVAGHDIVVNVAAYTAVDKAESEDATAFAINALGAANLARAATAHGARLVHLSTDYVFDGEATSPYAADAPLDPQSAYGRTKAAGEWAVRAECPRSWIVRTAWLYGAGGPSFPKTMAKLGAERESLGVVTDQVGQPTWTVDLAEGIVRIVEAGAPFGIWHGTNAGQASKFEQAQALFEDLGISVALNPITSDAFPTPAKRPAYSVLSHDMWIDSGIEPLPHWRDAQLRSLPVMFPNR